MSASGTVERRARALSPGLDLDSGNGGAAQGIALFKGGYNTTYPEQLATGVIACLPLVILYLFLSKYFVQGITMTGLKG